MKTNGENILKILYLAAASDGHIEPSEMLMFEKLRYTYVALASISDHRVANIAKTCLKEISSGKDHLELIREISESMNEKVKQITYALAVEICAANFDISNLEAEFLEVLRDVLGISESVSEAINVSAGIRYELDD